MSLTYVPSAEATDSEEAPSNNSNVNIVNNSSTNPPSSTSSNQNRHTDIPQDRLGTMNSIFYWAIQNSDPEKLKQMAQSGRKVTEEDMHWLNSSNEQNTGNSTNEGPILTVVDPVERMQICLKQLQQEQLSWEDKIIAIQEIQNHAEVKIDFACDFEKIGGFAVLFPLINNFSNWISSSKYTEVEQEVKLILEVLELLSILSQNNSYIQTKVLEKHSNIMDQLFSILHSCSQTIRTNPEYKDLLSSVNRKIISCLSSLLSNNIQVAQLMLKQEFILNKLITLLQESADFSLVSKLLFLLFNICLIVEQNAGLQMIFMNQLLKNRLVDVLGSRIIPEVFATLQEKSDDYSGQDALEKSIMVWQEMNQFVRGAARITEIHKQMQQSLLQYQNTLKSISQTLQLDNQFKDSKFEELKQMLQSLQ